MNLSLLVPARRRSHDPVTRPGAVVLTVGVGALAAGVGALAVEAPAFSAAVAVCALAAGILVRAADVPGARVWTTAFVLVSAAVNLPRLIRVGPTTGLGAITVLAVVTGGCVLLWRPARTAVIPRPLLLYVVYVALSLTFRPLSIAGGVTALTAVSFAMALAMGAGLSSERDLERSFLTLEMAMAISLLVGFAAVGVGSAITTNQNTADGAFSARPYAMLAVLALALALSDRRRRGRYLAAAAIVFALYSLSRSDLAAMAVMLIVGGRPPKGALQLSKLLVRVGVVLAIGVFALQHYQPLHKRFYQGDVTNVAGFRLNVEGRSSLWGATWHRAASSPLFGHGAGDADATAAAVDPTAGHPHNDYLRVLDDTGGLGLALLLAGLVALGRRALTAEIRNGLPDIGAAAFRALLGVMVVMVFDNPLIYVFVTVPFGVLLGMAVASGSPSRSPGLWTRHGEPAHAAARSFHG